MSVAKPAPPQAQVSPCTRSTARLRTGRIRAAPLLLLLLALATVFLFAGDRGHFYRPGAHDWMTANYLAVAANRSPAHDFLGFYYRTPDSDGAPVYFPYNRFPIGGSLLTKLAMLPFEHSLSAQIYAARLLMLSFFAAAAVLAYLSLNRLVRNRWIALTATLLAFSSYYCLYYNDMVATDGVMDLFAVLLTFHGMVVFEQEGQGGQAEEGSRLPQLLAKTCIALLLGWHVYALVFMFIVFGLARAVVLARRGAVAEPMRPVGVRAGLFLAALPRRHLTLGAVALLFGGALATLNLALEYMALKGETGVTALPTLRSALGRLGVDGDYLGESGGQLAWLPYLKQQALRVAAMCMPYALFGFFAPLREGAGELAGSSLEWLGVVATVAIAGALFAALPLVRHRVLLATLALSGFVWALALRYQVFYHDFESIYYIGVPLVAFALLLLAIRKWFGKRVVFGAAIGAALTLALSSFQMRQVGNDAEAADRQRALLADFDAIRAALPPDATVSVPIRRGSTADAIFAGSPRALVFYLSGRVIDYGTLPCHSGESAAQGSALGERQERGRLLTPNNRLRFLYDRSPEGAVRHWSIVGNCEDLRNDVGPRR